MQDEVWFSVPDLTDRTTGRGAAEGDSRPLDPVLIVLSRLAGHGTLWAGLAIGLWLTEDRRARRPVFGPAAMFLPGRQRNLSGPLSSRAVLRRVGLPSRWG